MIMLRTSFTKHLGNRAQPCPYVAVFWSAPIQLQMSSSGRGRGNWRSSPNSKTSRLQCWKCPLFWCYWNIKYHQSIYSLLSGIVQCCNVNGFKQSEMYSLHNTVILLWRSRVVSLVLFLGNWSWEILRTLPGVTEEVRDSNRNLSCQILDLLSPWTATCSFELKHWWI